MMNSLASLADSSNVCFCFWPGRRDHQSSKYQQRKKERHSLYNFISLREEEEHLKTVSVIRYFSPNTKEERIEKRKAKEIRKIKEKAKTDSILHQFLREDPRCRDIDPKFFRGNELYTSEPIPRVNLTVSFTFICSKTIFNFQSFLYLDAHTDRVCSQAV